MPCSQVPSVQAIYGRATGQLKNMGMMAFMMWMSGTQIQIFSIMMTANGIYQPIAAIANSGQSEHPPFVDHHMQAC